MIKDRVLRFDKTIISKHDIIENINYYIEKSNEGLLHISNKDYKYAMKVLKELKRSLRKEYVYYDKDRVNKHIKPNNTYRTYQFSIALAYSKLYKTYSCKYLYDNLYNIWDSVSNSDDCMFLEEA